MGWIADWLFVKLCGEREREGKNRLAVYDINKEQMVRVRG